MVRHPLGGSPPGFRHVAECWFGLVGTGGRVEKIDGVTKMWVLSGVGVVVLAVVVVLIVVLTSGPDTGTPEGAAKAAVDAFARQGRGGVGRRFLFRCLEPARPGRSFAAGGC